jgi:hypothetical protein
MARIRFVNNYNFVFRGFLGSSGPVAYSRKVIRCAIREYQLDIPVLWVFRWKNNIERHGPMPLLNNRLLAQAPCFSLYTIKNAQIGYM